MFAQNVIHTALYSIVNPLNINGKYFLASHDSLVLFNGVEYSLTQKCRLIFHLILEKESQLPQHFGTKIFLIMVSGIK
jgi:hypothetical protein